MRVLIVDDHPVFREGVRTLLENQPNIEVVGVLGTGAGAAELARSEQAEVVLLDEPTSALDPISTAKIEELLHELKEDYTIAIVTHNMQQAARVSDFTAYMYIGELVEYGVTNELFIKPQKKETEDYITGRFG